MSAADANILHGRIGDGPLFDQAADAARQEFTGPTEFSVRAEPATERFIDLAEWKGVYPGMCINPETCRGNGYCPRDRSCCE